MTNQTTKQAVLELQSKVSHLRWDISHLRDRGLAAAGMGQLTQEGQEIALSLFEERKNELSELRVSSTPLAEKFIQEYIEALVVTRKGEPVPCFALIEVEGDSLIGVPEHKYMLGLVLFVLNFMDPETSLTTKVWSTSSYCRKDENLHVVEVDSLSKEQDSWEPTLAFFHRLFPNLDFPGVIADRTAQVRKLLELTK